MRMARWTTAVRGVLLLFACAPAAAAWPSGATVPTIVSARCADLDSTADLVTMLHLHVSEMEFQIALQAKGEPVTDAVNIETGYWPVTSYKLFHAANGWPTRANGQQPRGRDNDAYTMQLVCQSGNDQPDSDIVDRGESVD